MKYVFKATMLIPLLSCNNAQAMSCKNLFKAHLEAVGVKKIFEEGTPVFENNTQVVARVSLNPNEGPAYARRGPVGPFTTLQILVQTNPHVIIEYLDHLIENEEYNLFMNTVYKISQMYTLSERKFRAFMASSFGVNAFFGHVQRKWSVLESVLDHYGVIRILPDYFSTNSINWITQKSLKRHYKKHVTKGQEFPYENHEDYELAAKDFWGQGNFVTITLSPFEGHFLRYNYMTYEFSVVRDGKIITYFRMTEEYRLENEFDAYIAKDLLGKTNL